MLNERRVTKESLQKLSLTAIVAFASRCARRAHPAFARWNESVDHDNHAFSSVESAIRLAEDFSSGKRAPHEICGESDSIPARADAAAQAANRAEAFLAGNAAEAAACAAQAAVNAADAAQAMTPADRVMLTTATAAVAYEAGQRMLLALEGNEKEQALKEAERDLRELIGDETP